MQQKHHKRTFRFVAAAATVTFVGAMLAVSATPASASDLDISAKSDNTWDPGALKSVVVGDVVTFKGLDEGEHDATGTVIPDAAAPIKSPTGAKDYEYSVTVAGKYKFLCSKHVGMNGSFTAAAKKGGAVAPAAGAAAPAAAAGAAAPAVGAAAPAAGAAAGAAAAPATHKVGTSGVTFTPATITEAVHVGDTIAFSGLAGHNATSTAGSVAKFASPADAATFDYKVPSAGKYTYECTFHSGMVGSFTAVAAGAAAAPGGAAPAAAGNAPAAGAQVTSIPVGGVQTGGGSTAGFNHSGPMTLGFGLLMAAFMTTVASRRVARQK